MTGNDIAVSVICTTYNHENFIRDCLEGFIKQKTDFRFEVIVHDDASTDNTAGIIREYEEKYPEIIKPIYQKENQYSQKINFSEKYIWPISKGKYIALCEGDDYWTDPLKLQKQYDFMESHSDYAICVHNAAFHNLDNHTKSIFPGIEASRDYSTEDIIVGDGDIFATNSVFAKNEVITNQPDCFRCDSFGDYQCFIYGSIVGKCRCLSDVMSVYNFGVPDSWSKRMSGNENSLKHTINMLNLLDSINNYYQGRYKDSIEYMRDKYRLEQFYILCRMKKYRILAKKEWKDILKKNCSLKERVYIYFYAYVPFLMDIYEKGRER